MQRSFRALPAHRPRLRTIWRLDFPTPTLAGNILAQHYAMDPGPRILERVPVPPSDWSPAPVGRVETRSGKSALLAFEDNSCLISGRGDADQRVLLPVLFHLVPPPAQVGMAQLVFAGVGQITGTKERQIPPLGLARLGDPVRYSVVALRDTCVAPDLSPFAQAMDQEIEAWGDLAARMPDIRPPDPDDPRRPMEGVDPSTGQAYGWPAALPVQSLSGRHMQVLRQHLQDLARFLLLRDPGRPRICLSLAPADLRQDRYASATLDLVSTDDRGRNITVIHEPCAPRLLFAARRVFRETCPLDPDRFCLPLATGGPAHSFGLALRAFTRREDLAGVSAHEHSRLEGLFRHPFSRCFPEIT